MLFVNVSITVYPEGGSTSQGEVEKKEQAEENARTIGLSSSFLISHRWRYFSERTTEGSGRS
jgi:hypothetical protein